MNVVQLMVTIIIVTILVTVILGVVSYIAYWLRRSRRPVGVEEPEPELRFFYRYVPEHRDVIGDSNGKMLPDAAKDKSALPAGAFASTRSGAAVAS
jgi:Tfp pilus assembly protein PilE